MENGFKTNRGGDNFLATGRATGTTMEAGNMSDPANNQLAAGADNIGTWDANAGCAMRSPSAACVTS